MRDGEGIDRPLRGIVVVDAVRGPLAPITRYLAELGAVVERFVGIDLDGNPVTDAADNVGKVRSDGPVDAAHAATARAHVIVTDKDQAVDLQAMRLARPSLVTMTVSDFGTDTSWTDRAATGPVLHALSGELARSGIRGRKPLLPPGDLAYQCAASQAAFILATALYRALRTGRGDHIDFSALDGASQALDPGYGIGGSASMGKPAAQLSRDRPAGGFQYPILRCADGYVRICLLSKRQWQGMFRWMGEPAAFASPDFEKTVVRYKSRDLLPAIAAFFAGHSRDELEDAAEQHGVPLTGVKTFEEAVVTDQMRVRNALTRVRLDTGETMTLPNGAITIDGERMGPAYARGDDPIGAWKTVTGAGLMPFQGLRVLDLGIIVVGAEQGRLLADGGADVVKVESRAYPDGNRQSYLSYGLSVSFAAGHRNKRSLGINLRDEDGRRLFFALVAQADVVLSNFKPGTLAALELDYAALSAANPAVILAESSAFGDTGPWKGRMGYGPLVRAATGLTLAWRYPDDAEGFCDASTIYPDHVAARVGALAVVALLIRRLRTGLGGHSSMAQSEVMLSHFATRVGRASDPSQPHVPPDAPWDVYQAQGDDEWCVVTVRNTSEWYALAGVIGYSDAAALNSRSRRTAARVAIDAAVGAWIAGRSSQAAETALQAVGVPAARMLRVSELPSSSYFHERALFRTEAHPYLNEAVIAERWSAKSISRWEAPMRAAPLAGEHSLSVLSEWLDGTVDLERLVATGAIEPVDPDILAAAIAGGSIPTRSRGAVFS